MSWPRRNVSKVDRCEASQSQCVRFKDGLVNKERLIDTGQRRNGGLITLAMAITQLLDMSVGRSVRSGSLSLNGRAEARSNLKLEKETTTTMTLGQNDLFR